MIKEKTVMVFADWWSKGSTDFKVSKNKIDGEWRDVYTFDCTFEAIQTLSEAGVQVAAVSSDTYKTLNNYKLELIQLI